MNLISKLFFALTNPAKTSRRIKTNKVFQNSLQMLMKAAAKFASITYEIKINMINPYPALFVKEL